MRKFFCLSAGLAACSVAGLASAEKPQIQSLDKAIEVQPIRMAAIDRTGKLLTQWFYTDDVQNDTNCIDTLVYDAYEPTGPDDALPTGGTECNPNFGPTTRWFFGASYCNTWTLNDIASLADGWAGDQTSDHHMTAWQWYGDGNPAGTEQCYLVNFTYEDFDDTCNGPAAANGYDGIIYDFGPLTTNPGGYYYTNLTPCDSGLALTLPADGSGALDLHMWNFFDGNNFTYATCGQAMLWGMKDTATQGSQGPVQWDDDTDIDANGNCTADVNGNCLNLPDGSLVAPFECYDYAFGLCPDPLGAMMNLYGNVGPSDCLSLGVDQLIGGARTTWTLSNGTPNATAAIVYGTAPGSTNVNGFAGYCASFGIKGVNQSKLICQKRFDGAGQFTCAKPIPVNLVGKQLLFQGAQKDTCPDQCMSNLLDLVVQ
jgi:hypothetical protein